MLHLVPCDNYNCTEICSRSKAPSRTSSDPYLYFCGQHANTMSEIHAKIKFIETFINVPTMLCGHPTNFNDCLVQTIVLGHIITLREYFRNLLSDTARATQISHDCWLEKLQKCHTIRLEYLSMFLIPNRINTYLPNRLSYYITCQPLITTKKANKRIQTKK